MMRFNSFSDAIDVARDSFPKEPIHTEKWQGVGIKDKPEMAMHELLFYSFRVPMKSESLIPYQEDIKPNLPWADDHFEERVCGRPINPGIEWENWPYAERAKDFLQGTFNHNYMERYWPKRAGALINQPTLTREDWDNKYNSMVGDLDPVMRGIRHLYGDLEGVVRILAEESDTRQAFFPVWFPEDTGDSHRGRKPCSLGYHFIMRGMKLHVVYYIRSCDFVRHFRDDIYLTVRLVLWVLNSVRTHNKNWDKVEPGEFAMHITSLHMFRNDYLNLQRVK